MSTPRKSLTSAGFTLIELVITVALVGLMAMMVLPLYEVTTTRMKESELRHALRTIREGLDAYKAAVDDGRLASDAGTSGYPPSLELLTEPLELVSKRDLSGSQKSQRMVILRQLPRDPFNNDPDIPAAQTWQTRAYASRTDDPEPGEDVFDVSSKSDRMALDGTSYSSW
ncbi:type II secretion system protein [Rhodoferax sp.]|uniref:type II secretion system protein n=1 Tax=Rhodoferax sp. TaxID=50421 RepID=UPI00283AE8C3|nr:type II secretion system protein [Rhodoferax sp.]MDR3370143.1 type II secretion system protein [Rhodoferax sp.]